MTIATAAWASVYLVGLSALVGAVWRVGTAIGGMAAELKAQGLRITKAEAREKDHDDWHRGRLERRVDLTEDATPDELGRHNRKRRTEDL